MNFLRFSDFLVNELSYDGELAVLNDTTIPPDPIDTPSNTGTLYL